MLHRIRQALLHILSVMTWILAGDGWHDLPPFLVIQHKAG
jgi:hypothetical protein